MSKMSETKAVAMTGAREGIKSRRSKNACIKSALMGGQNAKGAQTKSGRA
jgi:hypothetical protein